MNKLNETIGYMTKIWGYLVGNPSKRKVKSKDKCKEADKDLKQEHGFGKESKALDCKADI